MKQEVVITSGTSNQAPIGAFFRDNNVVLHIYEGSHTYENLKTNKFYIVNICSPYLIAKAVLDDEFESDFLEKEGLKIPYLKNSYKILLIEIVNRKFVESKNNFGTSNLMVVEGQIISEKVLKNNFTPYNRAEGALVEMAVLYSRLHLLNEEKKQEMLFEMEKLMNIVKKVGSNDHIDLGNRLML